MQHKGTVRIETDRLILRQFCAEDVEFVYHNFESDPKVTKFLTWKPAESIDTAREVVMAWVQSYADPTVYQWAIELKTLHQPVGTISVVQQNEQLDMVHIGYCLGSPWWHQGIMSEALAAITPFFFDEVGANRIESRHDPNNSNSGRVMKKCGMQYEGTLRQADRSNQGIVDASYYGLLRADFEQARKAAKKQV